jgi:acyl carrier protein
MNSAIHVITDNITLKIKEIIIYKLGLNESQLSDKAHFLNDLSVDSLDLLELQIELEKEFKITIAPEDAEKFITVGSVIQYVLKEKNINPAQH